MPIPTTDALVEALSAVQDPELRRPLTDLDMVGDLSIGDDGAVHAVILLTVPGCPMKDTLEQDTKAALAKVEGVTSVSVELVPMTDEQRTALKTKLRGGPEPEIPFSKPGNLTRVYAIASGKGGVGKSSVTANLAAAMAADGLRVGVIDADIYGFSIPRMLGADSEPTQMDDMILPVVAHNVKTFSIGMLVEPGRPVVWRGPLLHRALQQFLTDVFWGDLDVLLLDLPPGTGDVAISVAQLLPKSEIVIVTTPQTAAAEVAQRAGALALQTRQRIIGVIENMSWLTQPDGSRMELFGSGGGTALAGNLSHALGTQVPILGQVPIDVELREGSDSGTPVVISDPDSEAAKALIKIARDLEVRSRGLAGQHLGVTPVNN